MQFALREMERYRVPLLVWLTLSVVAGIAGPFGTSGAVAAPVLFAYWTGVVGVSILLSLIAFRYAEGFGRTGAVLIWVLFVLGLSGVLHAINSAAFPSWGGVVDWATLTGNVAVVTAAVKLVIWGIGTPAATGLAEPARPDPFMARVPIGVRGPLVRIEAQDHYLNVVTTRGEALILMRLSDAIAELSGRGLQVHRSHWVALDAVKAHRRDKGRDLLVMSDTREVPVSRSFRAAAQDAALF